MRRVLAAGLLAAAAGCGSSGHSAPPPTPTPTPSLIVQPVITISGTSAIEQGECVGFRIQTSNFTISPSANVTFGPYDLAPSVYLVLDTDTVEVGFPCFYTGLDLPVGPLDVAVIDGARAVVGAGAFTVSATNHIALGAAPADSSGVSDPDANALGFAHDIDVYDWSAPANGFFLSEAIVATDAVASFKPYQFVSGAGSSWNGSEAVIVPATTGTFASEIADDTVGGASTGFGYHFRASPLPAPIDLAAGNTCDALASVTTAGFFSVDLATATGDYNPAGSAACVDRHSPQPPIAGEGVHALGRDRAIKVLIPAGKTFRAAARGTTSDVVLYLVADSATPCATVSTCLAAADVFGPSDTDTLLYRNATAADVTAWLIVDEYGGSLSTPGPVTVLLSAQ